MKDRSRERARRAAPAPPATVHAPPAVVLALQANAGNQAVARMVAAHRLQRHPGKEGFTHPHKASDHADDADKREHARLEREEDRATQASADDKTSEQLYKELSAHSAAKQGPGNTIALPPSALPPKLQAQLRQLQATITDLENALADAGTDEGKLATVRSTYRARIRASARSWHDDLANKVPRPANPNSADPRAAFYRQWRAEEAESGADVPNKQRNKEGRSGQTVPYREYTAAGWKEAHTKGRFIYDPIDDRFYLTVLHYADPQYIYISAERAKGGGATQPVTDFDLDFLLFQAYEQAAAQVAALAARQDAVRRQGREAPTTLDETLAQLRPDARRYLGELFRLRTAFLQAREEGRRLVAVAEATKAKQQKRAALEAKGKKRDYTAPEATKPDEQYSQFQWFGQTWVVRASDGYFGYEHRGEMKFPAYKEATIGSVGQIFRDCVNAQSLADYADEDVALAIAALIVEPTRHPTAALEALFAVAEMGALSPFESSATAFGVSLPMAAGGTDQFGVPVEVTLRESRIGREVIIKLLSAQRGMKRESVEQLLISEAAARGPRTVVDRVAQWLVAALMTTGAQEALFKRSPDKKPTAAPKAQTQAASGPSIEKERTAADASPSATIVVPPAQDTKPLSGTQPQPPAESRQPVPPRSRWARAAADIVVTGDSSGPMSPTFVMRAVAESRRYEAYANFWDAYDAFRAEHPGRYVLSPVDVVLRALGRLPTDLYILAEDSEWQLYYDFKKQHPEFTYSH